jgi:hypothetical protein
VDRKGEKGSVREDDHSRQFRIYKGSVAFTGRYFDKYNGDIPEQILAMMEDNHVILD